MLTKPDISNPLKLKYGAHHASFLMKCLASTSDLAWIGFTLLIQVINFLLRQCPNLKIETPNNLMNALNILLEGNLKYQESPSVISNIIWLVGRCIQMSGDRPLLLLNLSESKLI
jgi:hypothetical protein